MDIIVTSGERAAFAARAATKTIPIVVTQIAMDPVNPDSWRAWAAGRERHRVGHAEREPVAEATRTA